MQIPTDSAFDEGYFQGHFDPAAVDSASNIRMPNLNFPNQTQPHPDEWTTHPHMTYSNNDDGAPPIPTLVTAPAGSPNTNGGAKRPYTKRPVQDASKFKTQICRQMLRGGRCPYGNKCLFAHSKAEQRSHEIAAAGNAPAPAAEGRLNGFMMKMLMNGGAHMGAQDHQGLQANPFNQANPVSAPSAYEMPYPSPSYFENGVQESNSFLSSSNGGTNSRPSSAGRLMMMDHPLVVGGGALPSTSALSSSHSAASATPPSTNSPTLLATLMNEAPLQPPPLAQQPLQPAPAQPPQALNGTEAVCLELLKVVAALQDRVSVLEAEVSTVRLALSLMPSLAPPQHYQQ